MYNLEEEQKSHPYGTEGRVFEEQHGEGKFLIRNALRYVIDDYDDYLGSVELSHYEKLSYNEVADFNFPEGTEELDFTWMNPDDVVDLNIRNEQLMFIRRIKMNIDNVGFSYLPEALQNVQLTINNNGTKLGLIQQIKSLRSFLRQNGSRLEEVKLEGFTPLVEKILYMYIKKYGIRPYEEEQQNTMNR